MRKVINVLAAISALLVLGTSCSKENPEGAKEYAIVALANPTAGGTVTGTGTYKEGQKVTMAATANAGYEFTQWNDGVTTSVRTVTVVADAVYTASFKSTTPTASYAIVVLASPEEGGKVTGSGVYTAGTQVTITATANEGYEFTQWSDGETKASRTITVTKNASYTATFKSTAPAQKETYITFLYYGDLFETGKTNTFELYIDHGTFDDEGYYVGEGYQFYFFLAAPTTSTATKIDTGNYKCANPTSVSDITAYTFFEGSMDDENLYFSRVYYQLPDESYTYRILDGGSITISKSGKNYTVAGKVSYWDYVTEKTGSYNFSFAAEAEFYDASEASSASSLAKTARHKDTIGNKYQRKSWKLRR